ncbi:MAG: hypothetical protein V3R64_09140 [Sphingomonadales bacterium]
MDENKIIALEVLGETLQAMIREKQLFLLLVSFLAITSMILVWPMLDWYILLLKSFPDIQEALREIEAKISEDLPYILLMLVPPLFITLGIIVLWTRAVIGGSVVAFEGGIRPFLIRILRVFWRYLCAMGIMIAAGFLITAPLTLIGADSGLALLLFFFLNMGFLILMFGVTFLLSVSLHGEARDIRLPIHKSFLYLKGNLLRATWALFLVMFIVNIIQSTMMVVLLGLMTGDSTVGMFIAFFILFVLSGILNFIWVGFGALYAVKLVPELKVN